MLQRCKFICPCTMNKIDNVHRKYYYACTYLDLNNKTIFCCTVELRGYQFNFVRFESKRNTLGKGQLKFDEILRHKQVKLFCHLLQWNNFCSSVCNHALLLVIFILVTSANMYVRLEKIQRTPWCFMYISAQGIRSIDR